MNRKITISMLLDFYGQLLSAKQLEIMNYYCNEDLSLSEIAEIIGITRQGVYDIVKRSELFLEELQNKLGLYHKWQKYHKWQNIQSELDIVQTTLRHICPENAAMHNNCTKVIEIIENIKNQF